MEQSKIDFDAHFNFMSTYKFKRNEKLIYKCSSTCQGIEVKYVKKFGVDRPNYVYVCDSNGKQLMVWKHQLSPTLQ